MATSAHSLAVINKTVRVVASRLHSTHCLIDHDGMGLGSRGPVSTGKNATLTSYQYTMINSSVTACDPFQKKHISSMSVFSKKRVIFKNVTRMATTILLHSQKVTACVCLECTRSQRQNICGQCGAIQQIVAALPSSKVSKEGHTALNPFLTALQCSSHEKASHPFQTVQKIVQVHSNAKPSNFQPTWGD